jgi:hypothetical protein
MVETLLLILLLQLVAELVLTRLVAMPQMLLIKEK